jgi:hypothetical protein
VGELVELSEYANERLRTRKVAANEAVAHILMREQQLRGAFRHSRALNRKRRR